MQGLSENRNKNTRLLMSDSSEYENENAIKAV